MGWLSWRSKKLDAPQSAPARRRPVDDADAEDRVDPAQQLRAQARRRLIGAAALLLAVAVVVPMILDDEPRPVADSVPIDIPSEKTPFTPRLSLPPPPEPGNVPLAPPPDTAEAVAGKAPPKAADRPAEKTVAKTGDAVADKPAEKPAERTASSRAPDREAGRTAERTAEKPASEKPATNTAAKPEAQASTRTSDDGRTSLAAAEEKRVRELLEGRASDAKPADAKPAERKTAGTTSAKTRFAVQAAAPKDEGDAQALAARLKKAGYASYVEPVQAKDGTRYRVRVGPFASRDEAERVRARLRALDVEASVVAPGT